MVRDKKRIRGLRRHFRMLQHWAEVPTPLEQGSNSWLQRYRQTFLQVHTDPWRHDDELPATFRHLWIRRLLLTYHHWHAQLTRHYPDFYLAINLHEPAIPEFRQSRLLVALADRQQLFTAYPTPTGDVPLPREYEQVPGISALQWQAYAIVYSLSLKEFEDSRDWVANKPYWNGTTEAGVACIQVQAGWRWVGQVADAR